MGCLIFIFLFDSFKNDEKEAEKKERELKESKHKEDLNQTYGLPLNCPNYQYLGGYDDREKYTIQLSDINFYSVKGNVRQEVETTGGDASLGETIINAMIDDGIKFIFFEGAKLYNYLLEYLPEKEQSFVVMNKQNNLEVA